MVHAIHILEATGIALLDTVAIGAFLLMGLLCVAACERNVMRTLAPPAERRGSGLAELLEELTVSIRSYAHGLLKQDARRFSLSLASILSVASGIIAFAAFSFGPAIHLANLNTGLILIVGASFLGILGGVLTRGLAARGGSLAGVARNAIRVASFEIAGLLALVSGVILSGSLSVDQIVQAQNDQGAWFIFLAPIGFLLFLASAIAGIDSAASEQGRNAADDRFRWPFGSLAATIHLLIGAGLAVTVFMGGWLRPFASYHDHFGGTPIELLDAVPPLAMAAAAVYCHLLASTERDAGRRHLMIIARGACAALFAILAGVLFAPAGAVAAVHGAFWFLAKMGGYIYAFLWVRERIPRFRFGRPIRAAWNFLIPLAAINAVGVAAALTTRERWDWSPTSSTFLTTLVVVLFAVWLGLHEASESSAYRLES